MDDNFYNYVNDIENLKVTLVVYISVYITIAAR